MSNSLTETDFFFARAGAEPLECEQVIRNLVLAERISGTKCEVQLDELVVAPDIKLSPENACKVASFLGRNVFRLLSHQLREIDRNKLMSSISWLRGCKATEDEITIVELPVEEAS